jgi:hypothetical protein
MEYKRKYIDTGSPRPLYDVLIYGFFFSYLVAWPQVGILLASSMQQDADGTAWLSLFMLSRNMFVPRHAGHLCMSLPCHRSTSTSRRSRRPN